MAENDHLAATEMSGTAIGTATTTNAAATVLSARVSAERTIGPTLSDLARMAAEEELKRRLAGGGGGGGSAPMKSPTQFVLYSMGLINQQMRAMYEAVIKAFEANQANTAQVSQQPTNALPAPVAEVAKNIGTALRMLTEALQRGAQPLTDLSKAARELGSNAMNSAIVSMSGWVSKALKLLGLANADDDNFETEDLAEKQEVAEEQINMTTRLFAGGDNQEGNGRTVISHIQNVADQMNRVVAALLRRD